MIDHAPYRERSVADCVGDGVAERRDLALGRIADQAKSSGRGARPGNDQATARRGSGRCICQRTCRGKGTVLAAAPHRRSKLTPCVLSPLTMTGRRCRPLRMKTSRPTDS